ncbi:MAG TPA: zinc ribbon domain-containing protein, partial [Solirubrobacteraceae bacterium]|nr:zinc ribbon domain-containing protein [Solirubrobacteraceae bacterium]
MPIYEYRREDGTTFEVVQSISEDPLTKDPETGQKVVRVLHAPSIHFKGSGFYNTDYGTKRRAREMEKSEKSGSSDDGAKSGGKGKDSGKADSKTSAS